MLAAVSGEMGIVWPIFFQLVLLLSAALLLGMVFDRLVQSAILGYLLAGTLMGPAVLDVIHAESGVPILAELGVSLLLFAIGLEFSVHRLLRLGRIALIGGTLQVVTTLALGCGIALIAGSGFRVALAVGAMVALSSTACVLRVLTDRAELDSIHGRSALGILLLQDVAVVPLVLLVTMLGGTGTVAEMGLGFAKAVGLIAALVAGFYLLSNFILPRMLKSLSLARDRELLILLAVILAAGSASAAHALHVSPALGAFIAGIMLAESPFATQIRSDICALRALFVTLFFASVGMLGDPAWILMNAGRVALVVAMIVIGKAAIITLIAAVLKRPLKHAAATGISLAQVGEFGVVIAGIAYADRLFDEDTFHLLVSATLVAFFLTPFLVRSALPLGAWIAKAVPVVGSGRNAGAGDANTAPSHSDHVIVVGFGPSGQRVAEELERQKRDFQVLDLRPANIELAHSLGYAADLGDATNLELLLHHGIMRAQAVVITVPDHRAVCQVAAAVRNLSPGTVIIARARYHPFVPELERSGATVVVDEEFVTGNRLAAAVRSFLMKTKRVGPARSITRSGNDGRSHCPGFAFIDHPVSPWIAERDIRGEKLPLHPKAETGVVALQTGLRGENCRTGAATVVGQVPAESKSSADFSSPFESVMKSPQLASMPAP